MFTKCTLACSHNVCMHVHRCTTHRRTPSTHLLVAVCNITDLIPREGDLRRQDIPRLVDIDPVSIYAELQVCPLLVLCGQEATETHQVLCSGGYATSGNQVNSDTQQHTASELSLFCHNSQMKWIQFYTEHLEIEKQRGCPSIYTHSGRQDLLI